MLKKKWWYSFWTQGGNIVNPSAAVWLCMLCLFLFAVTQHLWCCALSTHQKTKYLRDYMFCLFCFFVFQRKVVILFSSSQHLWLALSVRDSLIGIVSDGWYWCIVWSKHGCVLHRGYVFRAQTQEIKERGGNQTTGIDFFITQERVIFLDTQVRMKCHRCCDSRVFDLLSECITSE